MKVNFANIMSVHNYQGPQGNSSYYANNHIMQDASNLFQRFGNSPQEFVIQDLDDAIIQSATVDENEHYLVSFDQGVRKLATLRPDVKLLLKSQLSTDDTWLIQEIAKSLWSRNILVIEPFKIKETVQTLEIELRIKSYEKEGGGIIQDDFPDMPAAEKLASYYLVYEPDSNSDACRSLLTWFGLAKWEVGDILEDELLKYNEQLGNTYVKTAATNSVPVFTEASGSSIAMLAKVIDEPGSPEISLLRGMLTDANMLAMTEENEACIYDGKSNILMMDDNIERFKQQMPLLLNNHSIIKGIDQLVNLISGIPDFNGSEKEIDDIANQQKEAMVDFLKAIKEPLKQLMYYSVCLQFIDKHVPATQQKAVIDKINDAQQSLVDEMSQADSILTPCGFEQFRDLPVFFKAPTMNMTEKIFRHKTRTELEKAQFENLSELALEMVACIDETISPVLASETDNVHIEPGECDLQGISTELAGLMLDFNLSVSSHATT